MKLNESILTAFYNVVRLNESNSANIQLVKDWADLYSYFSSKYDGHETFKDNEVRKLIKSAPKENILELDDGTYITAPFLFYVNHGRAQGSEDNQLEFGIQCIEIKDHKFVGCPVYLNHYAGTDLISAYVEEIPEFKSNVIVNFDSGVDPEKGPLVHTLPIEKTISAIKKDIKKYSEIKEIWSNSTEIICTINTCEKAYKNDQLEESSFNIYSTDIAIEFGLSKKLFDGLKNKSNKNIYFNNFNKYLSILRTGLNYYYKNYIESAYKNACKENGVKNEPSYYTYVGGNAYDGTCYITLELSNSDLNDFEKNIKDISFLDSSYAASFKMPEPEIIEYFENQYAIFKVMQSFQDWFNVKNFKDVLIKNKSTIKKDLKSKFEEIDERYPKK